MLLSPGCARRLTFVLMCFFPCPLRTAAASVRDVRQALGTLPREPSARDAQLREHVLRCGEPAVSRGHPAARSLLSRRRARVQQAGVPRVHLQVTRAPFPSLVSSSSVFTYFLHKGGQRSSDPAPALTDAVQVREGWEDRPLEHCALHQAYRQALRHVPSGGDLRPPAPPLRREKSRDSVGIGSRPQLHQFIWFFARAACLLPPPPPAGLSVRSLSID